MDNDLIAKASMLIFYEIMFHAYKRDNDLSNMDVVTDVAVELADQLKEWLDSDMDIENYLWSKGLDVNGTKQAFNVKHLMELVSFDEGD